MRNRYATPALVCLALLASYVVVGAELSPDSFPSEFSKTIVADRGSTSYSYSVAVTRISEYKLSFSLTVHVLKGDGIYFLNWPTPINSAADRKLRIFVGYPYDYDGALPRFTFVPRHSRLKRSFTIDCRDHCHQLNFVDVTLFFIPEHIRYFKDAFATELCRDSLCYPTDASPQDLTQKYYESLTGDTVLFVITPIKDSPAPH
jgi:hypothetical protein